MSDIKHPLHKIRIASPCRNEQDATSGDRRVGLCGKCNHIVVDLSAMPEGELSIISRKTLWRRRDGKVMTSDCPVGIRQQRERRFDQKVAAAFLLFLAVVAFGFVRGYYTCSLAVHYADVKAMLTCYGS